MFTFGYIREAVMAHLDTDETEALAMNILSRLHVFANEAMQAICASKPMYQYIDVTVVEEFAPLVMDGASLRPATEAEINWDIETQGEREYPLASEAQTQNYYHTKNIYEVNESMTMSDTFIAFVDKQAYKLVNYKPTSAEIYEASMSGKLLKAGLYKVDAEIDNDFSYVSKNMIKFYKEGEYLIPAKYMWFRFDSGISDDTEIDMPSDIFLTIPLYITAVCYQIDNLEKAQIIRQEFEMALARCTATDFMTAKKIKSSW